MILKQAEQWPDRVHVAAFTNEFVNQLGEEFEAWRPRKGTPEGISDWRSIEKFLKDKYPAAHRGLSWGGEQASQLVRDNPNDIYGNPLQASPYESGPDAESQYGYDPKEVAAGMMLLHNQAQNYDGNRYRAVQSDVDLLQDIAQKRHKMQQDSGVR